MFHYPSFYIPSCIACGTAQMVDEWGFLSFSGGATRGSDLFRGQGNLEFNVCDACAVRAGERHRVRYTDRHDTCEFWPAEEAADGSYALPCILCGAVPQQQADRREFCRFYSVGFYESRIFDGGPDCLDVTVCSPCLIKAGERYQVWYRKSTPWGEYPRFWLHGM